jgi:Uma2 family endonuclease
MTAVGSRMSLEEFLRLPEAEPALEFDDGVVTQKVSPKARHSVLQTWLWALIDGHARPRRLGRAFVELRTTFAGISPVPDVSVYRWHRIEWAENGEIAEEFSTPPDIVFEIASPGQSVNGLIRRCIDFIQNGVAIAALVDASDRSVSVFRPGRMMVVLTTRDVLDFSDIIPDLRIEVAALFDALRAE